MKLSPEEIKKLQKLSGIQLAEGEEEDFFNKLGGVIDLLSHIQDVDLGGDSLASMVDEKRMLDPVHGVKDCEDTQALLENVDHDIINNSVVVKSVLK